MTADQIDRAAYLWARGFSSQQIADQLTLHEFVVRQRIDEIKQVALRDYPPKK